MRNYLSMFVAAAAGFAALVSLTGATSAMPAGRHQTISGNAVHQVRHVEHRNRGLRNFENRHSRHFRRGPVLFFGTSVHNDCYWLKRRAINSGSRYWWRRYNECRWG